MDRYEVIDKIGEGTYGVVLKCRDRESGEHVAIKQFKENDQKDEIVRKTTMREVKLLKSLKHENIITLKDVFRKRGRLHLVFEFYEMNMLEHLSQQPEGFPEDIVKLYMFQLVKAIAYCHENQVIHRDIKLENIMINSNKQLKLIDFGFARTIPKKETEFTDYIATRWYRCPSLLLGCKHYGPEVDIWAIGCIMAELLTGKPLFPGHSEIDQLYLIQKLLGPLTKEQTKMFFKNPMFNGYKFPDMTACEGLERRFLGKVSKSGLLFLKGCLKIDPKERFTSTDCLNHKFFESVDIGRYQVEPTVETIQKPILGSSTSKGNVLQTVNYLEHREENVNTARKKKVITKPSEMMTGCLESVDDYQQPEFDMSILQPNKRVRSRQGGRDYEEDTSRSQSRTEKRKPKLSEVHLQKLPLPKPVPTKTNFNKLPYSNTYEKKKPVSSQKLRHLQPTDNYHAKSQYEVIEENIDQENEPVGKQFLSQKKELNRAPSSFSDNLIHDDSTSSPRLLGEKGVKTRKSKSNLTLRSSVKNGFSALDQPKTTNVGCLSPIKALPKLHHISPQSHPILGAQQGRKSASTKKIPLGNALELGNIDDLEKDLFDHFCGDNNPISITNDPVLTHSRTKTPPASLRNDPHSQHSRVHLKPIQINN